MKLISVWLLVLFFIPISALGFFALFVCRRVWPREFGRRATGTWTLLGLPVLFGTKRRGKSIGACVECGPSEGRRSQQAVVCDLGPSQSGSVVAQKELHQNREEAKRPEAKGQRGKELSPPMGRVGAILDCGRPLIH